MADIFKKTGSDYLQQLDELGRLRKTGRSLFGSDLNIFGFRAPRGERVTPTMGQPTDSTLNTAYGLQAAGQLPVDSQQPAAIPEDSLSMSISDFTNQVSKQSSPNAVASSPDGGVILNTGQIIYQDGTFKDTEGSTRIPIPSLLYSDPQTGLNFYDDGVVRENTILNGNIVGIGDLIQNVFGGERRITQEYGNVDPSLGYVGDTHTGLDVATRDDPVSLPFEGQVVQTFKDDGTRFGDISGHQGYGNSVLIRTPTGEYLRFSHLSGLDVAEGDIIPAGAVFGITGTTGNSTGPHLDLEYIDANGNKRNPREFEFSGDISAGSVKENLTTQEDILNRTIQSTSEAGVEITEDVVAEAKRRGTATEQFKEQSQVSPQTEQLVEISQRPVSELSKDIATTGAMIKAPELGFSEMAAGQITPQENLNVQATKALSGTDERGVSGVLKSGVGASELLTGDVKGAVKELGTTLTEKVAPSLFGNIIKKYTGASGVSGAATDIASKVLPSVMLSGLDQQDKDIRGEDFPEKNKGFLGRVGVGEELPKQEQLGVPAVGQAGQSPQRAESTQTDVPAEQPEAVLGAQKVTEAPVSQEITSPLDERISALKREGKTLSTSKKLAKLVDRRSKLKEETPAGEQHTFTSTGYKDVVAEKTAKAIKDVKDKFYKSGFGDSLSYEKFADKYDSNRDSLQDYVSGLLPSSFTKKITDIQKKYKTVKTGLGVATTVAKPLAGMASGYVESHVPQGSSVAKVLGGVRKLKEGKQNLEDLFKRSKSNISGLFSRK